MSTNFIVNPDSKALSIVNQLNEEAKNSNLGEYVGSVILLSVQLRNDVYLDDIIQMMLDNPVIPDEWAPEPINHLTLYLSILSSMNKASLSRFDVGQDFPYTEHEHGGYIVTRLFKRSKADIPTAHKIFHLERDVKIVEDHMGRVTDKIIKDVKADEGIIVRLERTSGSWETDSPRGVRRSEFEIHIEGNNDERYAPLLETLNREFEEKRNEKYSSTQVRDLILDLVRNKLKALSITRGNYFLEDERIEVLNELRKGFQSLDPGINFIVFHQFRGQPGSLVNESFQGLVKGVSDALIKEVQDLHVEVTQLGDKESKTREATWESRVESLKELKTRMEKLRAKRLIESEIIDDLFEDCNKKIEEGRRKLLEDAEA
jgi:hypothetical protein